MDLEYDKKAQNDLMNRWRKVGIKITEYEFCYSILLGIPKNEELITEIGVKKLYKDENILKITKYQFVFSNKIKYDCSKVNEPVRMLGRKWKRQGRDSECPDISLLNISKYLLLNLI